MSGRKVKAHHPAQLGFGGLLEAADAANAARVLDRRTAHLPTEMEEGVRLFRQLIEQHHAAMTDGDHETVMTLCREASDLALKLNGGKPGFLADDDAAGCVLAARTAAAPGAVPLWGQRGCFVIDVSGTRVRIEMDGIFGIGGSSCFWLGFSPHAVDWQQPFMSETGYRSFLGVYADPVPGLTPAGYAEQCISAQVRRELRGRLVAIEARYREKPRAT